MSYQIYKAIHLTGIIMMFLSLGGLIFRGLLGADDRPLRKLGGLTNGIGLVLALIGGFGLLAKLRIGFPLWVIGKLLIWFVFGAMIAVINRKPESGKTLWWISMLLGLAAVYLAIFKPF